MSHQPDKKKDEEMSTAAKIGLAAGAAAVIGTAGFLLAKWFDLKNSETSEKPLSSYPVRGRAEGDSHSSGTTFTFTGSTALIVLEKVNKIIGLQKDDVSARNVKIKNFIRVTLIEDLCRSDELFKKLYQDILWTGSFYEGLKISAPDEFDLNIILRLPVNHDDLEVTTKGATKAYVCINNFRTALLKLKTSNHPHWPIYSKMEKWCDEKGSLLQSEIRFWMESLMDKYLNRVREDLKTPYGFEVLTLHKAGPAMMLQIDDWSIDLVPVIEFRSPMTPQQPFRKLPYPSLPWYAVPKPTESRIDVWRLSFCLHEKEMIRDLQNMKPAIRIIKKLRETRGWKNLCSYYIKTVALWEIHDDRNKQLPVKKLDEMFMHLLKCLQQHLEQDNLLSYWDPRYNLLEKWPTQNRMDVARELNRLIGKFEREYKTNPAVIGEIICNKP